MARVEEGVVGSERNRAAEDTEKTEKSSGAILHDPSTEELKSRFSDEIDGPGACSKPRPMNVKWRLKDRQRTYAVGLVLCLNVGVDPPDELKPEPCARVECWCDPQKMDPQKAVEQIGRKLQAQYERWQPKARFRQELDPTVDDVRKLFMDLRRISKQDRMLIHINGHGVPHPTDNGEIWVFNSDYTQYIPLSLYEVMTWASTPSLYVFDCSCAGLCVKWLLQFAKQRAEDLAGTEGIAQNDLSRELLLLASCGPDETLPTSPDIPADLFTACLTTPLLIALRWFCLTSRLTEVPLDVVDSIPGSLHSRHTPLGELSWLFTTVTDTIGWTTLPRPLFRQLFRQDLLVASLFRNFLLAERIFRALGLSPVSYPSLPSTYRHPLWDSWDLAVDMCLTQLLGSSHNKPEGSIEYTRTSFFSDHLTAFELWLDSRQPGEEETDPVPQLPILLQVLLSQGHRLRALCLLARFVDLGAWAVNQALCVGIFPYVLKLLQSPGKELVEVLVFIWAKIVNLDRSCQVELVRDLALEYFVGALAPPFPHAMQPTMAAYCLSVLVADNPLGQVGCTQTPVYALCAECLSSDDALLRRWSALCLSKLWEGCEILRAEGSQLGIPDRLCSSLTDPDPVVRGAALAALGTFFGNAIHSSGVNSDDCSVLELNVGLSIVITSADASPLVRRELVLALSRLAASAPHTTEFCTAATSFSAVVNAHRKKRNKSLRRDNKADSALLDYYWDPDVPEIGRGNSSIYNCLWKVVWQLCRDPYPAVANLAVRLVALVHIAAGIEFPYVPLSDYVRTSQRSVRSTLSPSLFRRRPSRSVTPPVRHGGGVTRVKSAEVLESLRGDDCRDTDADPDAVILASGLESQLWEWSSSLFGEPLFCRSEFAHWSPSESSPPSRRFLLNSRAVNVFRDCCESWRVTKRSKLSSEIVILGEDQLSKSALVTMDAVHDLIILSDEQDRVAVWDWPNAKRLHGFHNMNPCGSRITSTLIPPNREISSLFSHRQRISKSEDDDTLLFIGSDDGVVRGWRHFEDPERCKMVTAWSALPEIIAERRRCGGKGPELLLSWLEGPLLLASGGVSFVRVWDMNRELAVQDIPVGDQRLVTALCGAPKDLAGGDQLVLAGCSDGSLRVFDGRMGHSHNACVACMTDHKGGILDMGFLGPNLVASASVAGGVRLWTIGSPACHVTLADPAISCLATHPQAGLLVTGSLEQRIRVYDQGGTLLNTIKYHESFMGQRIGSVSCLRFHPLRVAFAASCADGLTSVFASTDFQCTTKKRL